MSSLATTAVLHADARTGICGIALAACLLAPLACSSGDDENRGTDRPPGGEDPDHVSAESLETATISLAGLGPVRIGMTFSEIESSAGVELTAVECDYKIDPGGFLNIVLETRNAETDDPTLSGIYIYEHDGLPSQIVPATAEGVRFGTPVDRLTETYPSATSLPGQGDGRYWLLEARAEGDLIAYVVDGAVAGLGSGDATELIEPNCT